MNTFGGVMLYDPQTVVADRLRFGREEIPELARVNEFTCPVGREPVSGRILLSKTDYDTLDPYSITLTLEVGTLTLYNFAIVQAKCVTKGIGDALYLVELTDARGVLYNRWFQAPLVAEYNLRAPAYPETFYYDSLNAGTPWTWASMLQNMWPASLGVYPGLPIVPSGVPENLRFTGVPVWTAICDILDTLGLTVAYAPTSATPYTIVQMGAADVSLAALETLYAAQLEDDLTFADVGSGRIPASVTVIFQRRNSVFGTEETVFYGNNTLAQQWATKTEYTITVVGPYTSATGTHYLHSDFTVRYDQNSLPLAEDVVMATAIATERVAQYFARIYHQTLGSMTKVYSGALPFVTGSRVGEVRYKLDTAKRHGWKTRVSRGL